MAVVDPRLPRPWQPQNVPTESDFSRLLRRLDELLRDILRRIGALESSSSSGSAVTTGVATLDFGAFPGSNEASVSVIGQATIAATSAPQANIIAQTFGSYTANDCAYLAALCDLSCSVATAGVGFTIQARSEHKLQGTVQVRWTWS